MKWNSTTALAAVAILAGAMIGAGGTLVLVGIAIGHAGSTMVECGDAEVREATAVGQSWLIVTPGGDGHRVHAGISPGGGWSYRFGYHPAPGHGTFTMSSEVQVRADQVEVIGDAADTPSGEEPKPE